MLSVPLVATAEDFTGIAAYMELHAINRFLGEGDVITGASIGLDMSRRAEFLAALKEIPRVSTVAIKETMRQSFRETTAKSMGLIQTIYLTFAVIVAFGVIYNNARISLAERARELATLRVIGMTQREVGAVLVVELVILALLAVPLGLLLGTGPDHRHRRLRQHRDDPPAARVHQLHLFLRGRHGDHRLHDFGPVRPPQTQAARPHRRAQGPGERFCEHTNLIEPPD